MQDSPSSLVMDGYSSNVPAFLTKLWTLVEDPETNHLICWSTVSTANIGCHQVPATPGKTQVQGQSTALHSSFPLLDKCWPANWETERTNSSLGGLLDILDLTLFICNIVAFLFQRDNWFGSVLRTIFTHFA